jgi:hypothetical protein
MADDKTPVRSCKSCGSHEMNKYTGEVALHYPGLKGLEKPVVWAFPEVFLCLNCGNAEFAVGERELRVLATNKVKPQAGSENSIHD